MKRILPIVLGLARCAFSNDVGQNFDPHNATAYELDYGEYPYRSYKSFDLISPQIFRNVFTPACKDGLYTFITPRGFAIDKPSNTILDTRGNLIWTQETDGQAYDLKPQTFQGKQYLSYWVGDDHMRGHGAGTYYLLDDSYQPAFTINAAGGLNADLHELVITPEGTALITVYEPYTSPDIVAQSGAPDYYIWDSLFQEIDIATKKLLFQWRASDHHRLSESFHELEGYGTVESPYDFYHINSIQKDAAGNYIISSRYTHSVSYINGRDGSVIWTLGGKRNMFLDLSNGTATDFTWQHDARAHLPKDFPESMRLEHAGPASIDLDGASDRVLLTLFDNASEDKIQDRAASRGMLLELNYPKQMPGSGTRKRSTSSYTVKLLREFEHPAGIFSTSQGSLQVLPPEDTGRDPKVLIGYGYNPVYTEFDTNGTVLCDMRFAPNSTWDHGSVQSYRTFRMPWVGAPIEPPSVVYDYDSRQVAVSWNGATEVSHWTLEHSRTGKDGSWSKVSVKSRRDFETMFDIDKKTTERYLRVTATNAKDVQLGVSAVVDRRWYGVCFMF